MLAPYPDKEGAHLVWHVVQCTCSCSHETNAVVRRLDALRCRLTCLMSTVCTMNLKRGLFKLVKERDQVIVANTEEQSTTRSA